MVALVVLRNKAINAADALIPNKISIVAKYFAIEMG
jgi:hypothetical protein